MAVALYMDHHVPRAITIGLRLRGVDVLTTYEDAASELEDAALLSRASALQRVLFTFDDDLLIEASERQRGGTPFSGLVYAHPMHLTIGACVRELELIAKLCEPADLTSRVEPLPL